ncbi:uncharacterized protein L201_004973 [Kwoniella dendrophila CBS 6074]|uniref:Integral membrane protein n=1 Tax=Kwoniella dendrophila CBS 6074 TaxID=1295534 RepID=A0AAX4JZU7_9TREE
MQPNKTVETALATVGAILWILQGFPQIWKSYHTKSTKGVSPHMMIIWAISSLFFMVYGITRSLAIPSIIQVHFSFVVFSISWVQCLYYSHGYSLKKAIACGAIWTLACAGFEIGSIFGLWAAQDHGTEIPMVAYGYMSSVVCVIGLLPQYYEIYVQKEVVGLSYMFIFTDIVGGLFYIFALMFRPKLDISAMVIYVLTIGMMILILVLALILNPKAAKRRRLEGIEKPTTADDSTSATVIALPTEKVQGSSEVKEKFHNDEYHSDSEPECGPSTPTGMEPHHEVPILEFHPEAPQHHQELEELKYDSEAAQKV